jgi:hypothetical protein
MAMSIALRSAFFLLEVQRRIFFWPSSQQAWERYSHRNIVIIIFAFFVGFFVVVCMLMAVEGKGGYGGPSPCHAFCNYLLLLQPSNQKASATQRASCLLFGNCKIAALADYGGELLRLHFGAGLRSKAMERLSLTKNKLDARSEIFSHRSAAKM